MNGRLGLSEQLSTEKEERHLIGALSWKHGSYHFRSSSTDLNFHALLNPFKLIYDGLVMGMSINDVYASLGNELKYYPLRTTEPIPQMLPKAVSELLAQIGSKNLEKIVGLSADPSTTLIATYITKISGLIIMSKTPDIGPIPVLWKTTISKPTDSPTTRKPISETNHFDELTIRLQKQLNQLESSSLYEYLGIKKGCGTKELDKFFYSIVGSHHPDRIKTSDAKTKQLANQVFIKLREVYKKTRLLEEQTSSSSSSSINRPQITPLPTRKTHRRPPTRPNVSRNRTTRRKSIRQKTPSVSPQNSSTLPKTLTSDPQIKDPSTSVQTQRPISSQATSSSASLKSSRNRRLAAARTRNKQASMPVEQLILNAARVMKTGSHEKAYKLMKMARHRGGKGFKIEAYSAILDFYTQNATADEALERLKNTEKLAESNSEKAELEVFIGHIFRIEKREGVEKHYQRACQLDPKNPVASRWARQYAKTKPSEPSSFLGRFFQNKKK